MARFEARWSRIDSGSCPPAHARWPDLTAQTGTLPVGSCARDAHLRAGFKCDFEFRGQVQFRQFVSEVLLRDAKIDHCSQMHIARYATTRLIIKSSHQILSRSPPGFVYLPVTRCQSNLERLPLRYGSLSDVAYSAYRH